MGDIVVPIMVQEPGTGMVHLSVDLVVGFVTACGQPCGEWPVILAFNPDCVDCINAHHFSAAD